MNRRRYVSDLDLVWVSLYVQSSNTAYYFKPYEFKPRLEYINELIEKYKPV